MLKPTNMILEVKNNRLLVMYQINGVIGDRRIGLSFKEKGINENRF